MINKKGYVLIYVLAVILLIMLLALSLTNFTMQRTFWANKSIKEIEQVNEAKKAINLASYELSNYFNNFTNVDSKFLDQLQLQFYDEFLDIENKYNVLIRDLTKESCVYPNDHKKGVCFPITPNSYTYVYEIVYNKNNYLAQRKLFLSMIPSYLYFALGSNSNININGGAYIDGDIYTGNSLYLADNINYIFNKTPYSENTTFLTVNANRNVYLNKYLYSCSNSKTNVCYNNLLPFTRNDNQFKKITNAWDYNTTFINTPPHIKKYTEHFLKVNFDKSYVFYLNNAINQKYSIDLKNIDAEIDTYITKNLLYEAKSLKDIDNQNVLSVVLRKNQVSTIKIDSNINFDKDKWIIINGDLEISNYKVSYITIDANILVTGNITIAGNVAFNSTIYALGKGLIHNANIKGINENQLVLLTKGDLQFSVINDFDNNFSNRIEIDPVTGKTIINPDIKGFFYTSGNVAIYAASSYITIEGGVFADDILNTDPNYPNYYISDTKAIGVLINSYRGTVTNKKTAIEFTPSTNYLQSRLAILHDIKILKNQPKGLPVNEEINYLFDNITIK